MRERASWGLAVSACMALLCAPALWNGFPFIQYDTGGYLVRWYEGYLVPSRPAPYGLLLDVGAIWNFWPIILIQAALTVWIVALVLRAHRLARPATLVAVIGALSIVSTLPWLTSVLLTDVFCGLAVLALYLLVAAPDTLSRWERIALIILIGFAGSTHSATFVLLVGLFVGAVAWRLFDRHRVSIASLRNSGIAVVLGAVMMLTGNFIVSGKVAWTPGGGSLLFGRMLQDGIVKRYLADHCPDRHIVLCEYRDELPMDADTWFWASPLFDQLGRFAKLGDEMQRIALDSLMQYPVMQAEKAGIAFARQLVAVRSGEGVVHSPWHSYGMMKHYTPWVMPALDASRQMQRKVDFGPINDLHYPLALLSLILLPLMLTFRSPNWASVRELAGVLLFAVLANAAVCGVFANPHDRYGARIVWLATLAITFAAARALAERGTLTVAPDLYAPPAR